MYTDWVSWRIQHGDIDNESPIPPADSVEVGRIVQLEQVKRAIPLSLEILLTNFKVIGVHKGETKNLSDMMSISHEQMKLASTTSTITSRGLTMGSKESAKGSEELTVGCFF